MTFDDAFDRLIGAEGGYVNNPADPGGETKFGISKRSYPHVDIANLTREGAKAIYLADFWTPIGDVDANLKFQVFDFAVNAGISTAIRKLQAAIGVADDGHWGPVSAGRLATFRPVSVALNFLAEEADYRRKLSTWLTFGSGWTGRLANDLRYAAKDFA
jgi:lysozyme family protein